MKTLAATLHISQDMLLRRVHLFGHSLGSAAAMQYASKHFSSTVVDGGADVILGGTNESMTASEFELGQHHRIVLVSPFTSMLDMIAVVLPFRLPFVSWLLQVRDISTHLWCTNSKSRYDSTCSVSLIYFRKFKKVMNESTICSIPVMLDQRSSVKIGLS